MENQFAADGMPGKVSIKRKPKGIGIEVKAIADASSNIIMNIEIQEGKELMKNKEYCKQYGAGTSQCLRMTSNWINTLRILVGDAAFGSVKTLKTLKLLRGLYFIGSVKTAHTGFPKDYFITWYNKLDLMVNRGEHILLKSNHMADDEDDEDIYAIGWADKKCFAFVSNVGVTNTGKLLLLLLII